MIIKNPYSSKHYAEGGIVEPSAPFQGYQPAGTKNFYSQPSTVAAPTWELPSWSADLQSGSQSIGEALTIDNSPAGQQLTQATTASPTGPAITNMTNDQVNWWRDLVGLDPIYPTNIEGTPLIDQNTWAGTTTPFTGGADVIERTPEEIAALNASAGVYNPIATNFEGTPLTPSANFQPYVEPVAQPVITQNPHGGDEIVHNTTDGTPFDNPYVAPTPSPAPAPVVSTQTNNPHSDAPAYVAPVVQGGPPGGIKGNITSGSSAYTKKEETNIVSWAFDTVSSWFD